MPTPGNKIIYHPLVVDCDIPALDPTAAVRIKAAIERKLTASPEIYGIPLRGTLKPYRKLRVGDWRVVFTIEKRTVRIIVIAHRREVYDIAERRV